MKLLAVTCIKPAFSSILKDKVNFALFIIPIMIGIALYISFGSYFFNFFIEQGDVLILNYLKDSSWGEFFHYIIAGILSILLFFIVNWTFVLFVSVLASPFNDMLSARIEKNINGKPLDSIGQTFSKLSVKFFKTIFTEAKKVAFILILTIMSLFISFIPFLAPISILITSLLLAVEFLDYNWSRYDMSFSQCRKDLFSNMLSYVVGGLFFFLVISVPLVNLIVPSLATSYFTNLWVRKNGNIG